MSIILMAVAIWLGTWIGPQLAPMLGEFGGGIIGSIIVGFIVYAIWALISGVSLKIWGGLIFAVLLYVAQFISGYLTSALGVQAGLIGTLITAILMVLLWSWVGGKSQKKGPSLPSVKGL